MTCSIFLSKNHFEWYRPTFHCLLFPTTACGLCKFHLFYVYAWSSEAENFLPKSDSRKLHDFSKSSRIHSHPLLTCLLLLFVQFVCNEERRTLAKITPVSVIHTLRLCVCMWAEWKTAVNLSSFVHCQSVTQFALFPLQDQSFGALSPTLKWTFRWVRCSRCPPAAL